VPLLVERPSCAGCGEGSREKKIKRQNAKGKIQSRVLSGRVAKENNKEKVSDKNWGWLSL
jgi:hypothetical protein